MSLLVTYEEFSPDKLGASEPSKEQIKKEKETIDYFEMKLHYNYGTVEDPVISDLFLELPELPATGIRVREDQTMGKNGSYTKKNHSMMIKFDMSDPKTKNEIAKALEKTEELHASACSFVYKNKGKVKMHDYNGQPGGLFKSPIYRPRDENTGEIIKGKNPNLWIKLRNYKNNKTLFTDLNGKVVDWSLLTDVDIHFVPLLHFEKIYVGAKASLQVYLASAILTKIVPMNTETRQMSTLERLKAKNNGLADTVEAQLADLRLARQEMLSRQSSLQTKSEYSDHGEAKMHNMDNDSQSIQDFLSEPVTVPEQNLSTKTFPTMLTPKLNIQPLKF